MGRARAIFAGALSGRFAAATLGRSTAADAGRLPPAAFFFFFRFFFFFLPAASSAASSASPGASWIERLAPQRWVEAREAKELKEAGFDAAALNAAGGTTCFKNGALKKALKDIRSVGFTFSSISFT